ncbi:MAG: phosphatidate cytidylyltransferase [Micavibrio sp.]|nr:MAG: phosphatidate cytidylyltransferase [Micavibrio sp.]
MTSLTKRILSSLVMLPLALAALWLGSWLFLALVVLLTVASVYEWGKMVLSDKKKAADFVLLTAGYIYILLAMSAFLFLRLKNDDGFVLTLMVLAMIWATDICAYFTGRAIGGPKMAPKISPNKTWAGLGGGLVGAAAVAAGFALGGFTPAVFTEWTLLCMAALGAAFAVIGQIGDLLVSALKRKYGIKDTGNLIPGHGGVLDRIDALLLAVPVFAVIVLVAG